MGGGVHHERVWGGGTLAKGVGLWGGGISGDRLYVGVWVLPGQPESDLTHGWPP
jgi:hypothetical protein